VPYAAESFFCITAPCGPQSPVDAYAMQALSGYLPLGSAAWGRQYGPNFAAPATIPGPLTEIDFAGIAEAFAAANVPAAIARAQEQSASAVPPPAEVEGSFGGGIPAEEMAEIDAVAAAREEHLNQQIADITDLYGLIDAVPRGTLMDLANEIANRPFDPDVSDMYEAPREYPRPLVAQAPEEPVVDVFPPYFGSGEFFEDPNDPTTWNYPISTPREVESDIYDDQSGEEPMADLSGIVGGFLGGLGGSLAQQTGYPVTWPEIIGTVAGQFLDDRQPPPPQTTTSLPNGGARPLPVMTQRAPCRRRRRRRMLTKSDIADISTMAALLGKNSEAFKTWLARATH